MMTSEVNRLDLVDLPVWMRMCILFNYIDAFSFMFWSLLIFWLLLLEHGSILGRFFQKRHKRYATWQRTYPLEWRAGMP